MTYAYIKQAVDQPRGFVNFVNSRRSLLIGKWHTGSIMFTLNLNSFDLIERIGHRAEGIFKLVKLKVSPDYDLSTRLIVTIIAIIINTEKRCKPS